MGVLKIAKRCRSIHRVNMKQISLIPNLSTATVNLDLDNDEGRAILAAVDEYSTALPRHRSIQVNASTGVGVYVLEDLIEDWREEHGIEDIQYPINPGQQILMDRNYWAQVVDPNTEKWTLIFSKDIPSGPFGILYNCPHLFDLETDETSISSSHEEAIAQWAAGLMLEMSANLSAQFSDRQIFENKDMGGLADRLQARADKAYANWARIIDPDSVNYNPTFVDWDVEMGGGQGAFDSPFHPSNLR